LQAAVQNTTPEDLTTALGSLPPAQRAKVNFALQTAAVAQPGLGSLVDELFEMRTLPPKLLLLEKVLCTLVGLDPGDDAHLMAQRCLYSPEDEDLAGELERACGQVGSVRGKALLAKLREVGPGGDTEASLADFAGNPDAAADQLGATSLLMGKAGAWLHALASGADPGAAFAELEQTVAGDPFLVAELFDMAVPPAKVLLVEQALCKAAGVEVFEVEGRPDVHLSAQRGLYSPVSDELEQEMAEAEGRVAEVRGKAFLAKLTSVKPGPDAKEKTAAFVADPELSPEKLARSSLLGGKVAAWLCALHEYSESL